MRAPEHDAASAARAQLRTRYDAVRMLHTVERLTYWDERVLLPLKGAAARAGQRAVLAGELHRRATGPALEHAARVVLDIDPDDMEARTALQDIERLRLLLPAFVRRRAAVQSAAQIAWQQARDRDDFTHFAPRLTASLACARGHADALGYEREPYEALLGQWEPGTGVQAVERLFAAIESAVGAVVRDRNGAAAAHASRAADALLVEVDRDAAIALEQEMLESVGFDWARGRIDRCTRAFAISIGPDDVRLATRAFTDGTLARLNSSLHESGHGTYAQALARLGVPPILARSASHGIDESQSRMVEVFVGGSDGWWRYWHPRIAGVTNERASAPDVGAIVAGYRASEIPSQRVGSDELSYNLHVQLRFELERALVNGDLAVTDLPTAWRDRMRTLLGVDVANDRDGCLQDVHWSIGQWGYFPTYMLGNVYAAQLYAAATSDCPDIEDELASTGSTEQLREWHDRNVYSYGRALPARDIIEQACGQPVSADALVAHLAARYGVAVTA